MIALRADHDIDGRGAGHDLTPFGLGDAASDGDDCVEALAPPVLLGQAHAPELRIDLLRRLLPDVAGVEDDEVGLRRILGQRVALPFERLGHALGIVGVHLAAEGLDMELLGQRLVRGLSHAPFVGHGRHPRQGLRPVGISMLHIALLGQSGYLPDQLDRVSA